jgi:hypothetical protein
MGVIYEYAIEMGSGAMIYISSFIKIGSGIQKLIGVTHRQRGDRISLLLFFQNRESRLKIEFTLDKILKYKISWIQRMYRKKNTYFQDY